jgi:hypothetical protein
LHVFGRKTTVLTNVVRGKKPGHHARRGRKLPIREMKRTKVYMEMGETKLVK